MTLMLNGKAFGAVLHGDMNNQGLLESLFYLAALRYD